MTHRCTSASPENRQDVCGNGAPTPPLPPVALRWRRCSTSQSSTRSPSLPRRLFSLSATLIFCPHSYRPTCLSLASLSLLPRRRSSSLRPSVSHSVSPRSSFSEAPASTLSVGVLRLRAGLLRDAHQFDQFSLQLCSSFSPCASPQRPWRRPIPGTATSLRWQCS